MAHARGRPAAPARLRPDAGRRGRGSSPPAVPSRADEDEFPQWFATYEKILVTRETDRDRRGSRARPCSRARCPPAPADRRVKPAGPADADRPAPLLRRRRPDRRAARARAGVRPRAEELRTGAWRSRPSARASAGARSSARRRHVLVRVALGRRPGRPTAWARSTSPATAPIPLGGRAARRRPRSCAVGGHPRRRLRRARPVGSPLRQDRGLVVVEAAERGAASTSASSATSSSAREPATATAGSHAGRAARCSARCDAGGRGLGDVAFVPPAPRRSSARTSCWSARSDRHVRAARTGRVRASRATTGARSASAEDRALEALDRGGGIGPRRPGRGCGGRRGCPRLRTRTCGSERLHGGARLRSRLLDRSSRSPGSRRRSPPRAGEVELRGRGSGGARPPRAPAPATRAAASTGTLARARPAPQARIQAERRACWIT